MGTNSSKKDEEYKNDHTKNYDKQTISTISSSFFNGDNHSNYSGIKSESGSGIDDINDKDLPNAHSSSKTEQIALQALLKENKVSTLFEWEEGGSIVYITGSFCSWTQFFIMTKQSNGIFTLVLDLPKGVYQYKYKVDEQWRYNAKNPVVYDSDNNVNNIIDTTVMSTITNANASNKEGKDNRKKSGGGTHRKKSIKEAKKDPYANSYPMQSEFNTDAPGVPLKYYSNLFAIDINSNQGRLGKRNNLPLTLYKGYSSSHKSLLKMPHISLSHLVYQYTNQRYISHVISSITTKVRNKMMTMVYYSPRRMH